MARRSDIDWEKIERLYLAGQLTIRQIADEGGVAPSAITRKAKKDGWSRDLSEAIRARTKAKVAEIDVAELIEQSARDGAHQSAQVIKKAIEDASDVAAGVFVRHRADVRLGFERAQSIEALLDEHMGQAECLADVVKAAQAFKALVDARAKLIDKEREAFGIAGGEKTTSDSLNLEVKFV